MKKTYKNLFFEMTAIVFLAVTIGVIWNYRLLKDVSTGKLSGTNQVTVTSVAPDASLIPAGLLQVKELFDKKEAVFVDARESSVFSQGHIDGALSLPLADLDANLADFMKKIPFEKNLVIYCGGYGCHDSKNLGDKLLQKGYRQILIFEGGYPEWKDAGFPIAGAIQ